MNYGEVGLGFPRIAVSIGACYGCMEICFFRNDSGMCNYVHICTHIYIYTLAWGFGMVSDFSRGPMDPLPGQQEVYVLKESLVQLMYGVYFLGGRIFCWAWPRDRLILLVMPAFKTSFMTQVLHTQGLRRRHGGRFACCRAYGMKGWWPANFHNLCQQVGRCWEMLGVWTQIWCAHESSSGHPRP